MHNKLVKLVFQEAHIRAKEILLEHKTVVHGLAHALLQKPTLQDDEIQRIIAALERK